MADHLDYSGFGVATESNSSAGDYNKYDSYHFISAAGMCLVGARTYDPSTGRGRHLDPVGFDAGQDNLYEYVGDDPTNATDPSGLQGSAPALAPRAPQPIHPPPSPMAPNVSMLFYGLYYTHPELYNELFVNSHVTVRVTLAPPSPDSVADKWITDAFSSHRWIPEANFPLGNYIGSAFAENLSVPPKPGETLPSFIGSAAQSAVGEGFGKYLEASWEKGSIVGFDVQTLKDLRASSPWLSMAGEAGLGLGTLLGAGWAAQRWYPKPPVLTPLEPPGAVATASALGSYATFNSPFSVSQEFETEIFGRRVTLEIAATPRLLYHSPERPQAAVLRPSGLGVDFSSAVIMHSANGGLEFRMELEVNGTMFHHGVHGPGEAYLRMGLPFPPPNK
jgi:RHS repeat-associated protein